MDQPDPLVVVPREDLQRALFYAMEHFHTHVVTTSASFGAAVLAVTIQTIPFFTLPVVVAGALSGVVNSLKLVRAVRAKWAIEAKLRAQQRPIARSPGSSSRSPGSRHRNVA